MIVTILSENFVRQYYRFYGARHSTIHLGFKINYEEEESDNYLPKIRNIMHLHEDWLLNNSKFFIWQQFVSFLYTHLKDASHIDPFYFNMLADASQKIHTQNVTRVILEAYLDMLCYEGRFHYPLICTACHKEIDNKVSFMRELRAFHPHCLNSENTFSVHSLEKFFLLKNSFFLDDKTVEDLFFFIF